MQNRQRAASTQTVQWEPLGKQPHLSVAGLSAGPWQRPTERPTVVSYQTPARSHRQAPLIVRANRTLRTVLVAMCGIALLGYGLDVAASHNVGKLQDQARRLTEQNTELSAQLLRVISFQGIQDSVLGRFGLRVPEQVLIVKEVQPFAQTPFKAHKHYLPLMAGY